MMFSPPVVPIVVPTGSTERFFGVDEDLSALRVRSPALPTLNPQSPFVRDRNRGTPILTPLLPVRDSSCAVLPTTPSPLRRPPCFPCPRVFVPPKKIGARVRRLSVRPPVCEGRGPRDGAQAHDGESTSAAALSHCRRAVVASGIVLLAHALCGFRMLHPIHSRYIPFLLLFSLYLSVLGCCVAGEEWRTSCTLWYARRGHRTFVARVGGHR